MFFVAWIRFFGGLAWIGFGVETHGVFWGRSTPTKPPSILIGDDPDSWQIFQAATEVG